MNSGSLKAKCALLALQSEFTNKNIQIMGNTLRFVETELLPLIHLKSHPKELCGS